MKVNRLHSYAWGVVYATEYIWEPNDNWFISFTIERRKKHWWGFGYYNEVGTHRINFLWWTYELYYDKP